MITPDSNYTLNIKAYNHFHIDFYKTLDIAAIEFSSSNTKKEERFGM